MAPKSQSPRVALPSPGKGFEGAFEFGARVLKTSVQGLIDLYKANLAVVEKGVGTGVSSIPMGMLWTLGYFDVAHGGAYACGINQRPFFLQDPTKSRYYAGELRSITSAGLLGYLSTFFLGTDASTQVAEILMDANCPHIFPKLLSDEAFAKFTIAFNQSATGDLFKSGATSVTTLVEGFSKAAKDVGELAEGYTESQVNAMTSLLKLAGPAIAAAAV